MIRSTYPVTDTTAILNVAFTAMFPTYVVSFDLRPVERYQETKTPLLIIHSPSYLGQKQSFENVFQSGVRGGLYQIEYDFILTSNARIDAGASLGYRGSIYAMIDNFIEKMSPVQSPDYWDYQELSITIGATAYTNKTIRDLGIVSIELTEGPSPDPADSFDTFVYSGKFLVTLLRVEDKINV